MGNIESFATGLSNAISGYLGKQQDQQRTLQTYAAQKQIDQSFNKEETPTYVTPEMLGGLFNQVSPEMGQSAANFVTQYNQKNPDQPLTWDQTTQGLSGMLDKISSLQSKKEASPAKHYLGNDPKGNAIFADNQGNMFGPDKQPYNGVVLPKSSTMPTSQARSSGEFAKTLLPHITEMRDLINQADQAGYIGPASGRVYNQFMAGKVGSTGDPKADQLLGRLRAMDSLMKTGAMKVHFGSRGGQNMYEHFSELLNTGKQSAAQLNGSLDTLQNFMQGYAEAAQPQGAADTTSAIDPKNPLGI